MVRRFAAHRTKKRKGSNTLSEEKDLAIQILSSINAQLFALRTQVNEKEAELVRNSTVYGSDHEAVLKTKENLSNLKNQLDKANIYCNRVKDYLNMY